MDGWGILKDKSIQTGDLNVSEGFDLYVGTCLEVSEFVPICMASVGPSKAAYAPLQDGARKCFLHILL